MARSLRPISIFPITTRTLDVLRVTDVTPGMKRVTLGGSELQAHTAANGAPVAAFRSDGFDDEFKLLLKHPNAERAAGPTQADGVLNWPRDNPHLIIRTYTVRRWDPKAGELDIDLVLHGTGPAAQWAASVVPGERMQIAGPKMSAGHPTDADWVLIAGDETALPAIARWLEEWPAGTPGRVFIEVGEESHKQQLHHPEDVTVTWLSRDGAAPGTTTLLFDAIRATPWLSGTPFAWVAGEATTLTPIRRWLRNEQCLSKEQIDITGYWRTQPARREGEDDSSPATTQAADIEEELHARADLFQAFALRTAITIGLVEEWGAAARSSTDLARALHVPHAGLVKLLHYLRALGFVECTDTERALYVLTPLGRGLENEHLAEELDLAGFEALRELTAGLELYRTVSARELPCSPERFAADQNATTALTDDRLSHEMADGVYVMDALVSALPTEGVTRATIVGADAAGIAHRLVTMHDQLTVTVIALPSELAVIADLYPAHDRVVYTPGSPLHAPPADADLVLFADVLRSLADADATHTLKQASGRLSADGRLCVLTEALHHDLAHDFDYQEDLTLFALHRGGLRTPDEHATLFEAADLTTPSHHTISWGYSLFMFPAPGRSVPRS